MNDEWWDEVSHTKLTSGCHVLSLRRSFQRWNVHKNKKAFWNLLSVFSLIASQEQRVKKHSYILICVTSCGHTLMLSSSSCYFILLFPYMPRQLLYFLRPFLYGATRHVETGKGLFSSCWHNVGSTLFHRSLYMILFVEHTHFNDHLKYVTTTSCC